VEVDLIGNKKEDILEKLTQKGIEIEGDVKTKIFSIELAWR